MLLLLRLLLLLLFLWSVLLALLALVLAAVLVAVLLALPALVLAAVLLALLALVLAAVLVRRLRILGVGAGAANRFLPRRHRSVGGWSTWWRSQSPGPHEARRNTRALAPVGRNYHVQHPPGGCLPAGRYTAGLPDGPWRHAQRLCGAVGHLIPVSTRPNLGHRRDHPPAYAVRRGFALGAARA